ncbi:MAG: MurT ligase domain-containing protein [Nocardioidaceae bacterium]
MRHTHGANDGRRLDLRLSAALAAAHVTAASSRRLGRGGGTSAPGMVADRIDPAILTKLAASLTWGAIVIAGTNGKTTTSRMIADALEHAGHRVIHNRSGSNLVRGVVAAFTSHAGWSGRLAGDVGVIESDEAAFPEVVRLSRPRVILLNNLFRDQLDRYGELDTILRAWRRALERLDDGVTVVVNADDPALVWVTEGLRAHRVLFGLNERGNRLDHLPIAADATSCRWCGSDLAYDALYSAHLGDWRCVGCGRRRPGLDVAGSDIELRGVESQAITVRSGDTDMRVEMGLPGLYNAYNGLAAVAVCGAVGVPETKTRTALGRFRSAFGRIERLTYQGHDLTLVLVKNPVGFNEVLRMLTSATGELSAPVMIVINDNAADGRDVSWLWDVDFELLAAGDGPLFSAGVRRTEMSNRLKYAGVPAARNHCLPADLASALEGFVASVPVGGAAYVLPTYTAMLELRRVLTGLGLVDAFWKQ